MSLTLIKNVHVPHVSLLPSRGPGLGNDLSRSSCPRTEDVGHSSHPVTLQDVVSLRTFRGGSEDSPLCLGASGGRASGGGATLRASDSRCSPLQYPHFGTSRGLPTKGVLGGEVPLPWRNVVTQVPVTPLPLQSVGREGLILPVEVRGRGRLESTPQVVVFGHLVRTSAIDVISPSHGRMPRPA